MVTAIQGQSLSSSVLPRPSISVCVHCRVVSLILDAPKSVSDKLALLTFFLILALKGAPKTVGCWPFWLFCSGSLGHPWTSGARFAQE